MGGEKEARVDPALPLYAVLAQRWKWFADVLVGRVVIGDVRITGMSCRVDTASVLVVVRGFHLERVSNVVAFGRGERLYEAFRNVTTTITKKDWRPDKFKPFV